MRKRKIARRRSRIERRVEERGYFRYADAVAVINSSRYPKGYRERAAHWLLQRTGARKEDVEAAEKLLSH